MEVKELIRQFLPKYLSPEDKIKLKDLIKDFPDNLDSRFYTSYLENTKVIYQGDSMKSMKVVQLPNEDIIEANCIVLSNT